MNSYFVNAARLDKQFQSACTLSGVYTEYSMRHVFLNGDQPHETSRFAGNIDESENAARDVGTVLHGGDPWLAALNLITRCGKVGTFSGPRIRPRNRS